MERSFIFRHRLKLFVAFLLVALAFGGLVAKTKLNSIKSELANTVLSDMDGKGYAKLVSVMSEAGAYVDAQTEPGSIDRAQGYRYAMRQVAQWQSLFMTDFNGNSPSVSRCPSRLCKYGYDNPDTVYLLIGPLSSDYNYRIKGTPGTLAYSTFQVFGIGSGDGFQTGGTTETSKIERNEDGTFELFIAIENPDGHPNHIQLPTGSAQLVVRQLMRDWNTETETGFEIEVINPDPDTPAPPPVLSSEAFDRRALGLARFVEQNMRQYRDIIAEAPLNQLPKADGGVGDGGFPTNFTTSMRYEISSGEGLLIEIPKADVVYSNIQLGSLWGESLVYAARTASFNDFQAFLDTDGVYRYVISETDPGIPNWLDATGHPKGGVFHRWQSPQGELPQPTSKVVKLSELRDHLPADHPQFSLAERAAQLRKRHAGFLRRQSPVY